MRELSTSEAKMGAYSSDLMGLLPLLLLLCPRPVSNSVKHDGELPALIWWVYSPCDLVGLLPLVGSPQARSWAKFNLARR